MLVLLGVLIATLAALLILPYYGRRASRLAVDALRRSMPLTESEIRADKDRLRAEHAVTIHKLEKKIDDLSHSAARQLVEINRRDAGISALESELAGTKTQIEEAENARRVLELTITDRLPRVEQRFADAKKLLLQRDREIATLTETATKQAAALEDAKQINAQQRDEIHRVNATLAVRAARTRETLAPDARFDEEVAIRTELEALRAKARDQAALIGRLQALNAKGGVLPESAAAALAALGSASDAGDAARLANDLAEAEIALRQAQRPAMVDGSHNAMAARDIELRVLKAQKQDGDAEIARLKAALKAYEADDSADGSAIKESKLALKARLTSVLAQSDQQQATIHSLRADIAAANERLARQATHFMDEMRRLGSGTSPTSGQPRRETTMPPQDRKRSLAERISAPRPQASPASPAAAGQPEGMRGPGDGQALNGAVASAAAQPDAERVSGFLRALDVSASGGSAEAGPPPVSSPVSPIAAPHIAEALSQPAASVAAAEPVAPAPAPVAEPKSSGLKVSAIIASAGESQAASEPAPYRPATPSGGGFIPAVEPHAGASAPSDTAAQGANGKPRRPGLLERLTGLDKPATSAD